MKSDPTVPPDQPSAARSEPERRQTLKRLGLYAAYTPPVVLTLLASRKTFADSVGSGGISPGGGAPP